MISFSISKEEINELPLGQFEGPIYLIDRPDQVVDAVDFLENQPLIGFDTETKPSFRKGEVNQVALLQLATANQAFIFRLNHIGFPASLRSLLEKENVVKVGAAVHDDLKALKKLTDSFFPQSFFDLNDENKMINLKQVQLFERIRDLTMHKNKLYMLLEGPPNAFKWSPAIGVISLD